MTIANEYEEPQVSCESCEKLRTQIVEALRTVDTDDWGSMEGPQPRSIGSILGDIASRLEALGRSGA